MLAAAVAMDGDVWHANISSIGLELVKNETVDVGVDVSYSSGTLGAVFEETGSVKKQLVKFPVGCSEPLARMCLTIQPVPAVKNTAS